MLPLVNCMASKCFERTLNFQKNKGLFFLFLMTDYTPLLFHDIYDPLYLGLSVKAIRPPLKRFKYLTVTDVLSTYCAWNLIAPQAIPALTIRPTYRLCPQKISEVTPGIHSNLSCIHKRSKIDVLNVRFRHPTTVWNVWILSRAQRLVAHCRNFADFGTTIEIIAVTTRATGDPRQSLTNQLPLVFNNLMINSVFGQWEHLQVVRLVSLPLSKNW